MKSKKFLLISLIVILVAAIVWATMGQANQQAVESASLSAEMERANLKITKVSKKNPKVDRKKAEELFKKIDDNDSQYQAIVAKAKSEVKSAGKVSEGTKNQALKLANDYKALCDQLAAVFQAGNDTTRVNMIKTLGNNRIKSATVLVNDIDQQKLNEMKQAQEAVKVARQNYVRQAMANDELSDQDKKDIRMKALPQINKLIPMCNQLVQEVTSLVQELQKAAQDVTSSVSSGNPMAALKGATGAAQMVSNASNLLNRVQTLLTVVQAMAANAQSLLADAQTLAS